MRTIGNVVAPDYRRHNERGPHVPSRYDYSEPGLSRIWSEWPRNSKPDTLLRIHAQDRREKLLWIAKRTIRTIMNSMPAKLRQTGIEALGEMPWGTHFC